MASRGKDNDEMKSQNAIDQNSDIQFDEAKCDVIRRGPPPIEVALGKPERCKRRRDPRVPRPGPLSREINFLWHEIRKFCHNISDVVNDLLPSWVLLRQPHVKLDSSAFNPVTCYPLERSSESSISCPEFLPFHEETRCII